MKILLYELDTLRAQVQDCDLDQFDMKTVTLRKSLLHILNEYKGDYTIFMRFIYDGIA